MQRTSYFPAQDLTEQLCVGHRVNILSLLEACSTAAGGWQLLYGIGCSPQQKAAQEGSNCRIFPAKYMHFLYAEVSTGENQHSLDFGYVRLFMSERFYRTRADISQHWCWISIHFMLGSSCESPVGAVQQYLKGWHFCNYLIIAPRFLLVLVKPPFQWKYNPTLLNLDKMWFRINSNSPVVFGVGTVGSLSSFLLWKHGAQTWSFWIEWKIFKVVQCGSEVVILH